MCFGIEAGPKKRELAGMVDLSDRTLRRRLDQHDTSYRALRDHTRYELARDLLTRSDMTMAQVAELLGYSDARAFCGAFKRWAGMLLAEFGERTGQSA